jgi:alpha-tubulin suppressor-like RCC1 family protein
MASSPSYRVRCGFAFAVTTRNGSVLSWGEQAHGGNSSGVAADLAANVSYVVGSRYAFSAIKHPFAAGGGPHEGGSSSTVVTWGTYNQVLNEEVGGNIALVANEASFVGLEESTGRVFAFGADHSGGRLDENNDFSAELAADVVSVAATASAFAALTADGLVYTWGNLHAGAGVSSATLPALALRRVIRVAATRSAFAALLSTRAAVTWGSPLSGGDSSGVAAELSRDVAHIVGANGVFAAFKTDSSLVTWGYKGWGGDSSAVAFQLSANVTFVCHTATAMAALKSDRSVVTWGKASNGGDSSAVQHSWLIS